MEWGGAGWGGTGWGHTGATLRVAFGLLSYRIGKATRRVASALVSIVEKLGGVVLPVCKSI